MQGFRKSKVVGLNPTFSTKERNIMSTHKQCNLVRGNQHYTAWIPSKKAILGKILKIENEDGWKVTSVGDMELDSKFVNERSQDYKDFAARIK